MNYKNVVLIGAPGSGKTTIGKLLANSLGWDFYDIDEYIEQREGKSIKDIFADGEVNFRRIESKVLKEIADIQTRKVISTGGGVVKLEENMKALDEKSAIIFINRPIEQIIPDLDITTRPLLSQNKDKIYDLYNERYPLYKKYCDHEILNNHFIEDVLKEILEILR